MSTSILTSISDHEKVDVEIDNMDFCWKLLEKHDLGYGILCNLEPPRIAAHPLSVA